MVGNAILAIILVGVFWYVICIIGVCVGGVCTYARNDATFWCLSRSARLLSVVFQTLGQTTRAEWRDVGWLGWGTHQAANMLL